MALQYLTHIDLKKNELRNAVIEVSANAPGTPGVRELKWVNLSILI